VGQHDDGDEWYGDKLGSFGFVPLVIDEAR
jgi:hypothetical protein